ncbi:MAG TPA: thioredoxin family protein [Flavobacteriaceae bacterium]|nr:thioredoxin family protein [Flavobacteriaceae bacterium]
MKKQITLLSVIVLLCTSNILANTSPTSIPWMDSIENAKKLSIVTGKPILLDFWAFWCGPCKKMDNDVWSKDEIKLIMENYIPVKIDFDNKKQLVSKYNVRGIPYIFIVDGLGNELYSSIGYKDKNFMLKVLKNFAVNLTTIHAALQILEKDLDNMNSNLRVSQKFQDVAFFLDDDARRSFLRKSNFYLKKTEKCMEDKDPILEQKVSLLKLLNKAYGNVNKSVFKAIENDFNDLHSNNLKLYNYIKFYSLFNKSKEEEYEQVYNLLEGIYKKKADYLIKNKL